MYRALASPLLSLALLVCGAQLFQIFISIAMEHAGYTEFSIGLTHSASYLGLLLSALYSERIINRIGHIRSFATFSAIITATIILQTFAVHLPIWMLARFFSGIALAGLYMTIESWLLVEGPVEQRGTRLTFYMVILYSSQALSSQLLHMVDLQSKQPYLLAASLCVLSSIPVCVTKHPSPIIEEPLPLKVRAVFGINPFGFLGCLTSGIILSSLYSFLPNFALEHQLSVPNIMLSLICGAFLMQWPLSKLADIITRERMLISLCFVAFIPILVVITNPTSWLCFLGIFLIGGLSFTLYPISIALVCDAISHKHIVKATGVLLFSYGIGSVVGPLLVSGAIDISNSDHALFFSIACVMGCFGAFGCYKKLWTKPQDIPAEESVDCIPLPRQSPVALNLNPTVINEEQVSIPDDLAGPENDS